jgi:hypothetical protein
MEYILSIDIGIKNLAFCLFGKTNGIKYKIIKWNVIDLTETDIYTCLEINKDKSLCNKKAVYKKNNQCFCLKHSKKTQYLLPLGELKKSKINKLNLIELKNVASKYIQFDLNIKKKEIFELLNNFIKEKTLEPIQINKCKDFDLITLTKTLNYQFQHLFNDILFDLKNVYIELQMTSKMRCLSFIIMQYFLVKNNSIDIQMVNPCFKLKNLEVEKTDYGTRKKNSIKHCQQILIENNENQWIDFFTKHTKKDDLSDCFLQGLYMINNESKKA